MLEPRLRDVFLLRRVEGKNSHSDALLEPCLADASRARGHHHTGNTLEVAHDVRLQNRLEPCGHLVHTIEEKHQPSLEQSSETNPEVCASAAKETKPMQSVDG